MFPAKRVEAVPADAGRASDVGPAAFLVVVAATSFVLYVGTASFGFVFDDERQVLDDATIRSWGYFFHHFQTSLPFTPYYRPLFAVWESLNYTLFGLRPAGWHIASVLAHVAATVLVYFVVRRLALQPAIALLAALIFGVHPVHIESVAWVGGVCDPLFSIFFLAAFLCYLKVSERAPGWTAAALGLYLLALLCKEPAATFPGVVAAHALIYHTGNWRQRITAATRKAAPFVILTVAYLFVRQAATRGIAPTVVSLDTKTVLLTIPSLLWFYVRKLAWPIGLSVFYDTPYVSAPALRSLVLPAAALLLIGCALWLWQRRSPENSKLIIFAGLWFVLVLLPVLYIPSLSYGELAHDRYLYLPLLGFAVLFATLLQQVFGESHARRRRWVFPAVAGAVAAALCGLNLAQQVYWANDLLLYHRGFSMAPNNDTARNNLARVFTDRGEYDRAEPMYLEILRHNPNHWLAHYNLGYTYYRKGRYQDADSHLSRALLLVPNDAASHLYLGLVHLREGRLEAAEQEIRQAISLRPDRPGYHLALGYVLEEKGDTQGALRETQRELSYSPDQQPIQRRVAALQAKLASQAPAASSR